MAMTQKERDRFDLLLSDAIESLPENFRSVIDEIPVIVVDRPDPKLLAELREEGVIPPADQDTDPDDDLMGLHSGLAITERSVDSGAHLPGQIHIFREAIIDLTTDGECWEAEHADEEIYEEIRITLLHEIGHHFGLDEDELDRLGYS